MANLNLNKVVIGGRITADPEMRVTPTGIHTVGFSIAINGRGKNAQVDFIDIVAWRGLADTVCKYFKKGSAILVCGELQTRSWSDQQGNKRYATEVVANEVSFCEAKNSSEGNSTPTAQNESQGKFEPSPYVPQAYTQPNFEDVKDDDLPF